MELIASMYWLRLGKTILITSFGSVLIAFFCSFQVAAELVDRVIAVVNDEVITLQELQQEMEKDLIQRGSMRPELSDEQRKDLKNQVLEFMINNILFQQEAQRLGIRVSNSEVDNRLQLIEQEHGLTRQDLQNFLEAQNMDIQEYRQWLKEEITRSRLLRAMVRQKVVVTQEEIETYYEENIQEFEKPAQVALQVIVHRDKEKLASIRDMISSGELAFQEAAREFSQGPSADQGGDLGSLAWKDLSPAWQNILQDLEPGEMSKVFPVQNDYALILLREKQIDDHLSLQDVREEIQNRIFERKLEQRYQEYVQALRSRAAVDVRL